MYDIYYRGSDKYKDACEIGKREYAAFYRSLVMLVQLKQCGGALMLSDEWMESDLFLWGGGDVCNLIIEELHNIEKNINAVIDNKVEKFSLTTARKVAVISENDFITKSDIESCNIVVIDVLRLNQIITKLVNAGLKVNQIISIEELIAASLFGEIN